MVDGVTIKGNVRAHEGGVDSTVKPRPVRSSMGSTVPVKANVSHMKKSNFQPYVNAMKDLVVTDATKNWSNPSNEVILSL